MLGPLHFEKRKDIKRWSFENFYYLVSPFMFVGKEMVIHALTMFDFLYCSRDENRLLGTIASRVCHMTKPEKWRPRRNMSIPGQTASDEDYNYLSFTARSEADIFKIIAQNHEKVGLIRAEDIKPQLKRYLTTKLATWGLKEEKDSQGHTTRLVHCDKDNGNWEERPVLIINKDMQMTGNKAWQCAISVEFLEKRFNFNIETDTLEHIEKQISSPEEVLDANMFHLNVKPKKAYKRLEELVKCQDKRSPIVASIRQVLNSPVLEKSPYEHDVLLRVPDEVYRYWTFFSPDDILLDMNDADHGRKRVPIDGTCQLLYGYRKADGPYLMVRNFTKPLPTATRAFFAPQPEEDMTDDEEPRQIPAWSRASCPVIPDRQKKRNIGMGC